MPVKRKRNKPVGDVTAYFVELAKQLPQVQRILLSDFPGAERKIWTVIDARNDPPDIGKAARRQVYDAESDAVRHGTELVDFRVVHVQEFHYPVVEVLPHDARVLFDRKNGT